MSSTTDNSAISAGNDVGAPVPQLIQTQTTLEAPAPHSVEPHPIPDVISPSTRTSMTRVDHDEDSGPRQSLSHEPATIPTAPTPAQQAAVNISSPSLPSTSVVQEQPPHLFSAQLSMSNSPLAEISTSEQDVGAVESVPQTPQTYVTFLHISGRRRTMAFDPETTIGRLKELVWNSWPGGTVAFFLGFIWAG